MAAVVGIVLLAAGALILAGTGLQVAPTADSVRLYSKAAARDTTGQSFAGGSLSQSWTPAQGGTWTGASAHLGGSGTAYCLTVELRGTSGTVLASSEYCLNIGAPAWVTFPRGAPRPNVYAGLPGAYSIRITVTSGNPSTLVWREDAETESKFLVSWGIPFPTSEEPPKDPGPVPPPSGPGENPVVGDNDSPPPPPPSPSNIGRLALMGLGLILIVFGIALVATDAMEFLGG